MNNYDAQNIRNICLVSHGGVGKTTLAEVASFISGATKKLGKVDNGTSHFDTRADEKDRKMTISMAVAAMEWNDKKINLLDTPGFLDLLGEVKCALKVVESAVILIDATSGIQVGTELVSRQINDLNINKSFFINGMDKENADFSKVLNQLKDVHGSSIAPVQIPIGSCSTFTGVIDLIHKQAFEYIKGGDGNGKKIDLPTEYINQVEEARNALMESVAESDEVLLEKFFDAGELTDDELQTGLAKGILEGSISPVMVGCATENIGVDLFLNTLADLFAAADTRKEIATKDGDTITCDPSGKTVAYVFKTTSEEHVGEMNMVRIFSGSLSNGQELQNTTTGTVERIGNVNYLIAHEKIDTNKIPFGDIGALLKLKDTHTNNTLTEKGNDVTVSPVDFGDPLVKIAIIAANNGEDDKVSAGIKKIHEEDPTFTYNFHADIHQTILACRGDQHMEIIIKLLSSRFKLEVKRIKPKISYRETITKSVKYVEYTHKKQSGGAGQYARVFIDLEPTDRGDGYVFEDKIVGGVIDQPLRPSVDKGIKAKIVTGIIAGYPIVDVKATLVDGKTHPVDSKDVAFQIAGREVFKKAFTMANPILLEPVVTLTVTMPDEYLGDVMGDLSSRRGKISGMVPDNKYQVINATIPEAEVATYSQALRSLTHGRGFYSIVFSHYDPVPHDVQQKIIDESKEEHEQA